MSDSYSTIYYEERPTHVAPSDIGADVPWLLIIPLLILAAAIIYLMTLPASKKDGPKTLREKINEPIDRLIRDAELFNREEAANALREARRRISDTLDKD